MGYTWQYKGPTDAGFLDIIGWNKNFIPLTDSALADNGTLVRCIVTGPIGSLTSRTATFSVVVGVAPTITQNPVDQTVTLGQPATFAVQASGTPSPLLQWYRNGVMIAGATSATYTTPATIAGDDGAKFYAVATNSINPPATSQTATLHVKVPTSNGLAIYDPSLSVPACATVGSMCDSGSL